MVCILNSYCVGENLAHLTVRMVHFTQAIEGKRVNLFVPELSERCNLKVMRIKMATTALHVTSNDIR